MSCVKKNGFTLVELLVAIGIVGFLSAIIGMTFSIVTMTSGTAMGQGRAMSEARIAGKWISRDVMNSLANSVQPTAGNTLCSMQSYAWNGSTQSFDLPAITYEINDGILTRTSQVDSNPAETVSVARFIDSAGTSFVCEDNTTKYYRLTVKAGYGNDYVTEVYRMKQVLTQ